ncbi:T9SS type B sorting domain-containing protein [Maribacter sp. 2210JD10-5]|uniref:T9SS type B sorting domain-containing protein n=1 Tax=Maribacter sp. 2210JD10-5 TaxID=3386272 RepID=UPI0039BC7219
MLPKKPKYTLYTVLLLSLLVVGSTAIANSKVRVLFDEVSLVLEEVVNTATSTKRSNPEATTKTSNNVHNTKNTVSKAFSAPMFATIIQGADGEENCDDNGFTIARFNLCGDSDDRIISLSGGPYSTVSWEIMDSCTPDINAECPNTSASCYNAIASGQTFSLDASGVPSTTGAEYRVVADGQIFYFKVKKSSITLDFDSRNFICGVPGRIQLLGLSSAYEYSINGGTTWQPSPVFPDLPVGDYNIITRLQGTPGACEYPYETIRITEEDININVTVTDAVCFGQNGSISVAVDNNVPGPYKYTLLDDSGNVQEFTSFITNNSHVFGAVAFGTYSIQVETPQCAGDASMGIPPPRQNLDTSGNPLVIGSGITQITASAEHTESLSVACGVNSVDISLNISGGTAPYTYTVSGDGATYGPIGGTDTYTVTTADTYVFTIRDANNCEITVSDPVEEITPPDVTVSGVNGTCTNGGARLEFNVLDAKGYTLSFRADSADPWSPSSSLSVAPGTYNDIQVRYQLGANDCILQLTPPQPAITVTSDGGVDGTSVKIADQTCLAGGGTAGGSIEVQSPTGGSGSYEYSIDGVNFGGTSTFTGLLPGNYTPYIRDSANPGCVRDLTPITINAIDPPTDLDFALSNIDCAAGTLDITLTETASATISTYEIIAPAPTASNASGVFTGLLSGTNYTFRITDANNCTYEENYIPTIDSSLRARVKSGGDRRVCPSVADGTGVFLIDGFLPDTPGNDYNYVVTYTPLVGPVDPAFSTGSSSDLEIPITGLGAGNYSITVTDNDTNCTATADFDVEEPVTPLSATANETAMSCANNNIGRVAGVASGGFGGYRYRLDGPTGFTTQGPKTGRFFGNLIIAGTYTLTVIDSEGCEATDTFTLTEVDAPSISLGVVDYCYGPGDEASITVSSTVGSGNINDHQYRIVGGSLQVPGTAGTFTFDNLVPGTYEIEVVNVVTNCSTELPFPVIIPRQVEVDLEIRDEIPCGGNGEMRISVSEGDISDLSLVSYNIILDDGINPPSSVESGSGLPSNPYDFSVSTAGSYTVEITDNNGCPRTSAPIVFDPPNNIAATERIVGPSCSDPNSGFVEILPTVSSGVPPFEIVFAPAPTPGVLVADPNNPNAGATSFTFTDQTIYSGLPAGFYEYVVKDDRDCVTAVTRIEVVADGTPAPDTNVAPIDASCDPLSDVVSGGVRILNAPVGGVPEYTFIVEDLFGNEITRVTTDGSTTYPLDIINDAIVSGNYRLITLDSRGCNDIDDVTVGNTIVDIVPDNTTLPVSCSATGFTYCVDIVGGVGPFDIRLVTVPASAFGTPNSGARRHCFPNIQLGETFVVEVRDNDTGCIYEEEITVPDQTFDLDVNLTIDNGTCIPGDLVELTYTVAGTTGNLDIEILNLDTGAVITDSRTDTTFSYNVPQGEYSILIYDNGTTCSGGDTAIATLDMPRVDVIENINANCNALGQLTVRGSGGDGGPYVYAFVPAGTPSPIAPSEFGTETTVALPGSLAPGISYDIWVQDGRGCQFMTSAAVVQLDEDLPIPDVVVNNQCITGTPPSSFTITVEMPGNVDTPTFTLNGVVQTPTYVPGVPTQAVFTVGGIGTYDVNVIDANGCDVDTTAEVFQILSASGGFSTDPTCTDSDGVITINADGGSGNFDFELQNAVGGYIDNNATGIFSGIPPGDYQVVVTDDIAGDGSQFCSFTVDDILREDPTAPVIQDIGKSDMSCRDVVDGSIGIVLQSGTDIDGIREYNLYRYSGALPVPGTETPIATNASGSFDNLDEDTYTVQVVTDRGCFDEEQFDIINPPLFEISAPAVSFACETGANRFSTATISTQIDNPGNGAPYRYRINPTDSYQSSGDFVIVDDGTTQTITIYAIDSNNCEDTFDITIAPPTNVTATITQVTPMNCEDPERIRIAVTGTTNFTIEDQGTSIAAVADQVVSGAGFVEFDLPMQAGEYRLQVNDNGGCTYPILPYTVNNPIPPTVTISEAQRVTCSTPLIPGSDGALSINIGNYVTPGNYQYQLYSIDGTGVETAIGVPVSLNTSTNPELISGLPGGNYRVDITTSDGTKCPASSNVATIRTPIPLSVTAIALQEAGCSNDFGQIDATGLGGWISAGNPYEYQLRIDDGTSTYPNIVVPFSTNSLFENLAFGDYRVEVRDEEGCPATFDISVVETIEIQAEIREPSNLICPGDNNAVLEVYDPRTGDIVTATTGVSGGVPGAGYKLRLLYLNSNAVDGSGNPTDIRETGGYQDPFVFTGSSGGTIGAGWYAIEIESGFGCSHITQPYEVIAPPPLIPNLDLVQVPGCGGDGILRLRVENGDTDPSVVYEYRRNDGSEPWQDMNEDGNTAVTLPRPADVNAYIFEVREKGSSCAPVPSDGVTLTDATDVNLFVSSPDDISCASELDGRIEYSATQGLGIYQFTLYQGDPGPDAYNPSPSATILATSTTDGAFENLGPGTDYYIGVTSGVANCEEIGGPFAIIRPDPIVVDATPTPVTCNGEEDGTITVEVESGGIGLLQFAIEPNFDEFFSDPATPGIFTFEDLAAGTYEVLVKDDKGCSEKRTVEITEPDVLQIVDISTTPELCIGASDGTAQFNISGGTPFVDMAVSPTPYFEYKVEMIDPVDETGTAVFEPFTGQPIENLQGGASYAIYIQDANLCPDTAVFTIGIGVDLRIEPVVEYGCEGIFPNSTTTITIEDQSLLPDLMYALDPADPTDAITAEAGVENTWGDLVPGDHTVYVYHSNGCTSFEDFTIDSYEPLTLTVIKTAENELTATAEGGFGGYEYFFNSESFGEENVYITDESGIVDVRVVDIRGCVALLQVPFEFNGMIEIPNFFTPDGDTQNDVWSPNNRELFNDVEVKIYDRYGRVVAVLDKVKGWDGKYEGKEVPTGDYWYVVNANSSKSVQRYVGHFTLYR